MNINRRETVAETRITEKHTEIKSVNERGTSSKTYAIPIMMIEITAAIPTYSIACQNFTFTIISNFTGIALRSFKDFPSLENDVVARLAKVPEKTVKPAPIRAT